MYNIAYSSRADNKVELLADYTYKDVTVPRGFVSDGLTIPLIFRLVVNKYSPRYLPCAFVHDMLTDNAALDFARGYTDFALRQFKEAGDLFEAMLKVADGGKLSFKSKLMIKGVRIYHKIYYRP